MEEMEDGFYTIRLKPEPREHIALNLGPKDQIWHQPSCNFWNFSLLQLLASLSAFEYTQRFNSFGIAKLVPHLYILPHTHLLSSFPHNFCIEKTPFQVNQKQGLCQDLGAAKVFGPLDRWLSLLGENWNSDLNKINLWTNHGPVRKL